MTPLAKIDRLADQLAQMQRTIHALSSTPQLAASSIVDGAITQTELRDTGELDEFGVTVWDEHTVSRYGKQPDGSNTLVVLDGPKPPRPVAPAVTSGPGYLSVEWSGEFEDAFEPYLDHDFVAVHASTSPGFTPHAGTLVASIRAAAGETVVVPVSAGTWFVSLVAVAQSGRWSDPAPYSEGEPGEASGVDVVAREMATEARNLAAEADRRAAEGKALADAVSSAANRADGRAIDALTWGTTSFLAADGKSTVTYSLQPPAGAAGGKGDTWFQVDRAGTVIGFWECTTGDTDLAPVEATPVTPAEPTFGEETVTVPATPGVTYLLRGLPAAPGTYSEAGPVAVVATADAGYKLSASARTAWVGTLTPGEAPPAVEVSPVPPTFTDAPGVAEDTIMIPEVEGVAYWSGTDRLAPGAHAATGAVTITATPEPGYAFPDGAATSWEHTFTTARTPVTPAAPTFTDVNGTSNDTVTLPTVEGVNYLINGDLTAPGTYPASGRVVVTAAASGDRWVIATGATTRWEWTFDPASYVTPQAPTWGASSYTIPAQTGVQYSIAGQPVPAGTYSVAVGTDVISTTDFTGSDGAPWPAPWNNGWGRWPECVADIRGNRGRMRVAGGGNWADKLWRRSTQRRADIDITYKVQMNASGDTWHHLIFRSQQADEEPQGAYDILFNRSNVQITVTENWSGTTIGQSTAIGMALGGTYWVRGRIVGSDIAVKLWRDGTSEPSAWTATASNTRWSNGHYGFLMVGGANATGYEHYIDDITVRDPAGAGSTTITVDAAATAGYTLAPGATTRWSRTWG